LGERSEAEYTYHSHNDVNDTEDDEGERTPKTLTEQQIQDLLHQSLMEMELMHRQEELEQQELVRAVAMSIEMEEERLHALSLANTTAATAAVPEAKSTLLNDIPDAKNENSYKNTPDGPSASSSSNSSSSSSSNNGGSSRDDHKISKMKPLVSVGVGGLGNAIFADPKPLKLRGELGSKPLPSIRPSGSPGKLSAAELSIELENKKREAEEALKRSQEQLLLHRQQEEDLRKQLKVDPDEAERRALHMREQRDRLIAAKKAAYKKQKKIVRLPN